MLFVTSAGNSGPADRSVGSPGSADAALTVGSVDESDQLAGSSSRGPRRGDWAIKPDLTAPGVDIVSARADGTALGPVVDEHYTRIGGTSMAAPHVAAAAAILLQREPDLTAEQLKSALVTTGVPHGGLTVFQQGGGRIDVPAALDTPVLAAPAPLDLGYFPYPHDDDEEPAHAEVTYTNRGDEPVTLHLSPQVATSRGVVPGPGVLSLDPASLAVEPGDTATTTVTLDLGELELGLYGGYLVVEAGGEVVSRTPVGFHKEAEMYDITIQGIDRNGGPAAGASNVAILDVQDMSRLFRPGNPFSDGQITVRVPPGTYAPDPPSR